MKTPQKLAKNLQEKINIINNIYLKREDLHPLHSHKGRSIPVMIKKHHDDGHNDFCISSSGNAALAAILAIQEYNKDGKDKLSLQIFVGNNIDPEKFKILRKKIGNDSNISIEQTDRPKQKAFQLDKDGKAKFLRQSTDEYALIGYHELAKELSQIPDLKAVFIPTSSGTTAVGLYEGFEKLDKQVQIHIVQTEECPTFSNIEKGTGRKSLADAIVDKVGHRKVQIWNAIEQSGGDNHIAFNEDIQQVIDTVQETEKLKISGNSALSIVGLKKAIKKKHDLDGSVVCLITGR